jgi:hypothetical protein
MARISKRLWPHSIEIDKKLLRARAANGSVDPDRSEPTAGIRDFTLPRIWRWGFAVMALKTLLFVPLGFSARSR